MPMLHYVRLQYVPIFVLSSSAIISAVAAEHKTASRTHRDELRHDSAAMLASVYSLDVSPNVVLAWVPLVVFGVVGGASIALDLVVLDSLSQTILPLVVLRSLRVVHILIPVGAGRRGGRIVGVSIVGELLAIAIRPLRATEVAEFCSTAAGCLYQSVKTRSYPKARVSETY